MKIALTLAAALLTAAPAWAGPGHLNGQEAEAGHDHGHPHADFVSGRFHVRVDGPEHPVGDVILIPGLASSPHVWDALTDQLKGRYRVHRLHLQGFAGAEAKDNAEGPVAAPVADELARYIAEQGLTRPAVIGHSMGGTMGLMLAARHPDSVGRLMVVDMLPFVGAMFGAGQGPDAVAAAADAFQARSVALPRDQWVAENSAMFSGMIRTEAARARPLADVAATDQAVAAHAMRELMTTDLRPELARITAPTQVLYVPLNAPGMTEAMTDALYADQFAGLSGAKLERIDGAAHFIMLDQPALFGERLETFLR